MTTNSKWPETLCDGLALPCGVCGEIPRFDWIGDDETWREVAPEEHRLSVICLPCFDRLAVAAGVTHNYVENVQFIGEGRTFILGPEGSGALPPGEMYVWSEYK
jgi:hypothetical protein